MRINVPSAIRESERTLLERDTILAEAHDQAARIIHEAQQQAMAMLSEDRMVMYAQQESGRILNDSQTAANRRTQEADRYAISVLQDLSSNLSSLSGQVANGLQLLGAHERTPNAQSQGDPAHHVNHQGPPSQHQQPHQPEPHQRDPQQHQPQQHQPSQSVQNGEIDEQNHYSIIPTTNRRTEG